MYKKTAVITGASSGIGMELAPIFASRGYDLILVARRGDRLQELADDMNRMYGFEAHAVPMDLAQPYAGEALWRAISEIEPNVDVLVNNAGFSDASEFADEAPEQIERMIHLNVSTLTSLTRHALPGMLERKHGRILNVASLAGFQPGGPGMAVYYASKSYVLSFSRSIRSELHGSGVSVTALCPGATATEFEQTAGAKGTRMFSWTKPMDARAVAHAAYFGMLAGSEVVVPGWLNRLMAVSPRLGPAAASLAVNRWLLSRG